MNIAEASKILAILSEHFNAAEAPDWRKDMIADCVTNLARALDMTPRESDPYGPLDFVAKILYAHDCEQNKMEPVRWWALRDELKERFRQQAVNTVASWATEELEYERLMGQKSRRILPRR